MPNDTTPSGDSEAFAATTADRIVGSLQVDGRLVKGSDPDAPVAGLLAAAAAVPGPLDEAAYRRFVESSGEPWPSADDLIERYGSFAAALEAAGIAGNPPA
jgi:hypothetical protein